METPTVEARGEREFGVALTLPGDRPEDTLADATRTARQLGASIVEINIDWSRLETGPGEYVDPAQELAEANETLADAESVYLNIAPFQTTYDARPQHLRSLAWDDPTLVAAYRDVIAFVLDRLPDLEARMVHVMIGNEVEFTSDAEWQAYADFLVAAAPDVKDLYQSRNPTRSVTTSVKIQAVLTTSESAPWVAALWSLVDQVNVTFYPLDEDSRAETPEQARLELDAFMSWVDGQPALGPAKQVLFSEVGYPTSALLAPPSAPDGVCNQARFISEVFSFWDAHASRIPALTFVWLADLNDAQTDALLESYGLTSPPLEQDAVDNLFAFLRTLGLHDNRGAPKAGATQLLRESCRRGWVQCP